MQTAYLNWFNQPPARDNPASSFQAPLPHMKFISGDFTTLPEKTAPVHVITECTDILPAKGDDTLSLRPVNSIVQHGTFVRLNNDVQIKLDKVESLKVDNDSAVKQEQTQDRKPLRESDEDDVHHHHHRDNVLTDLETPLQRSAAKKTFPSTAPLIDVAVVQPPLPLYQGAPPFPDPVFPDTLTDSISDVRDIADNLVQQYPAPRMSRPIAADTERQSASVSARQRKRLSGHPPINSGYRRDATPTTGAVIIVTPKLRSKIDRQARSARGGNHNGRSDPRRYSMAKLRSQIERQASLARRDIPHDEPPGPPHSMAYYILPTGPPVGTASSDKEPPVIHLASYALHPTRMTKPRTASVLLRAISALQGQGGKTATKYPRPSSGSGGVFNHIPARPRDGVVS